MLAELGNAVPDILLEIVTVLLIACFSAPQKHFRITLKDKMSSKICSVLSLTTQAVSPRVAFQSAGKHNSKVLVFSRLSTNKGGQG